MGERVVFARARLGCLVGEGHREPSVGTPPVVSVQTGFHDRQDQTITRTRTTSTSRQADGQPRWMPNHRRPSLARSRCGRSSEPRRSASCLAVWSAAGYCDSSRCTVPIGRNPATCNWSPSAAPLAGSPAGAGSPRCRLIEATSRTKRLGRGRPLGPGSTAPQPG